MTTREDTVMDLSLTIVGAALKLTAKIERDAPKCFKPSQEMLALMLAVKALEAETKE